MGIDRHHLRAMKGSTHICHCYVALTGTVRWHLKAAQMGTDMHTDAH
ncbi:unnamed protein product [Staurois parvus]|uniref:Uncharacterized protein n=1 Tax=Staurois parvus TaxID=386267 RepID=A0ABN9G3A4_9NEOB|nr:unnamed protein product [Staurois parvus]